MVAAVVAAVAAAVAMAVIADVVAQQLWLWLWWLWLWWRGCSSVAVAVVGVQLQQQVGWEGGGAAASGHLQLIEDMEIYCFINCDWKVTTYIRGFCSTRV